MRVILEADQSPRQNHKEENLPALPQEQFLLGKEFWTDIEPGEYSLSDYDISNKLIHLLRHGQHVHREDDGAVQCWTIKDNLLKQFPHSPHWSDSRWKVCLAGRGGNKRRFQHRTDSSGTIVYLRALQGHSGRNLIDPSLQDNVLIPDDFFEYIYHIGCAINLHSIIHSGLILGGQNLSKRQTVFFTSVDPTNKEHKDPDEIILNAPLLAIHAQSMEETSKSGVLGRYQTCSKERIKVLSDAIERHHPLQHTLPACCIPMAIKMGKLE